MAVAVAMALTFGPVCAGALLIVAGGQHLARGRRAALLVAGSALTLAPFAFALAVVATL
tara:strand:+ start:754 stop:930 length:177 start_codon:yes stop_codon:yes gene_type:complete